MRSAWAVIREMSKGLSALRAAGASHLPGASGQMAWGVQGTVATRALLCLSSPCLGGASGAAGHSDRMLALCTQHVLRPSLLNGSFGAKGVL